jgi:hypothetical protein
MRVLSLTNPWAVLMPTGYWKRIETRGWSTQLRGPLLIHASKGFPRECQDLCGREPFFAALTNLGYRPKKRHHKLRIDLDWRESLPRGLVVGRVDLIDCVPTRWLIDSNEEKARTYREKYELGGARGAFELEFGDYSEGRFAWLTDNTRKVEHPFAPPESGFHLGVWSLDDAHVRACAPELLA